jgi:hypothetical protein
MTVRASMDVVIYDVSIHGWANNAYRTPSCLLLHVHHAPPALMLVPSRLPNRSNALQDNIQCLHMQESMAVANQREKNSFYPQAPPQEEEAKHCLQTESTIKAKLRTYLVPVAVSVFKVGCCVEGQLRELLASHHLRELPSIS